MKCLGEFGYERYKVPLIRHILVEAIKERTLSNALSSCINYWIDVVRDDKDRLSLHEYAQQLVDEVNQ